MAKVYTFLVILAGMSLLLAFAGIPTGSQLILSSMDIIQNPSNFTGSSFYQQISAILAVVAVATIIVGFFTKGQSETFIVSGFAAFLFSYVADAVSIITYLNSTLGSDNWVTILVTLILAPLIFGFGISIIEWWRGGD